MPRIRYRKCYMNFEREEFMCDGAGKLTQPQVNSVFVALPTTGAGWIERGHLRVQAREGAKVFDLGPVAEGVTMRAAQRAVRFAKPLHTPSRARR